MADNVIAPGAGTKFATDEIGDTHYPRSKVVFGANGQATDVSAADPLPVSQDLVVQALTDNATGADIATLRLLLEKLASPDFEAVGASQSAQPLGATGAAGDLLTSLLIVPLSLSPGAVSIQNGDGAPIVIFAGGAGSVSTLHPFGVSLGAVSTAGAWKVNTGANVAVIATGNFT